LLATYVLLNSEDTMKQSDEFLENAENCAQLAERAADKPTHNRFRRMEAAWRALAQEQDWLDGEVTQSSVTASRWFAHFRGFAEGACVSGADGRLVG
jgi:hypothetical protein